EFLAPAVDVGGRGKVFVLTVGGEPGTGAATLYRWTRAKGVQTVADIAAYQQTDPDPYDLDQPPFPEEANPYGVPALPDGGALGAGAANTAPPRVSPTGRIVTGARLKPRVVAVPEELPDEDPE